MTLYKNHLFKEIRGILVSIYDDQGKIEIIVQDSGVRTNGITYTYNADFYWCKLLTELELNNEIEILLETAINQYRNNKEIRLAYDMYKEWVSNGKPIQSELQKPLPTITSTKLDNIKALEILCSYNCDSSSHSNEKINFILAVGNLDEISKIKLKNLYYGIDGYDWKPFFPIIKQKIAIMLQLIAAYENYNSKVIDINSVEILSEIENIKANDETVIICIDPYSLFLPSITDSISQLEKVTNKDNCIILPWNSYDAELNLSQQKIEEIIDYFIDTDIDAKDSKFYRKSIVTQDKFFEFLDLMLSELRAVKMEKKAQKLHGTVPHLIDKPVLSAYKDL